MKTVSKYLNMACMAMLIGVATGCTSDGILNNDDQASTGQVKMDTISITTGTADTRIAYDDAQLKLTWEAGDQIKVCTTSDEKTWTSEVYTLVGEGESTTGTFVGKELTGLTYMIVYPKDALSTSTGKLNEQLDNTTQMQNGDNDTKHLKNYLTHSGNFTNLASAIDLTSSTAILKFHFTNLPTDLGTLSSITWKSSIEAFYVSTVNGIKVTSSSQTLGLNGITITDSDQEVTAYMAVYAPSTLTAGSTIRAIVTGTNGKSYYAEATINGKIKYEKGKRYTAEMDGTTPMAWTEVVN